MVTAKSKLIIGFISRRFRKMHSSTALKKLYMAYLLPLVEYGSLVWWDQSAWSNRTIETVQKTATRMIMRSPPRPHLPLYISYPNMLKNLEMMTLKQRRELSFIMLIVNIEKGLIKSTFMRDKIERNSSVRTRSSHLPYNTSKQILQPILTNESISITKILQFISSQH